MNRIALVIPTYNCATQAIRVLEKICTHEAKEIDTIFIVDNQSYPEQVNLVKSFLETYHFKGKVKFFQNVTNLGLGASFKRSWIYLRKLGFDQMIFLHGDDQADFKDYLIFRNSTKSFQTPIAFGARFMKEKNIKNYSFKRLWANQLLNRVLTILTGVKIWELGSGLNSYQLTAISDKDILNLSNDITFDLEFLIFCIKRKIEFTYFPISWKSEDEVSSINEIVVGCKLIKIMFDQALFSRAPGNIDSVLEIEEGWKLIYG